MTEHILSLVYFMLPAYFANMMPVICKNIFNFLNKPIDFGASWKGKVILGNHKTVRGFIVGIIAAIVVVGLQVFLFEQVEIARSISIIDYSNINIYLLGFLFGFGALAGDAIESFIKRRKGLKPSQSWKVWDQLDYVIGSIILVWFFVDLSFIDVIIIMALSFTLTVIINYLSFFVRIRKVKW